MHDKSHIITDLKPSWFNQFPFILEINCGYHEPESNDQNDEINPLNLSEGICKEYVQKKSDTCISIA